MKKNVYLLILMKFLLGFMFFLPFIAIYYEQKVFSITLVGLLFALGTLFQVIFEVPSGAFADLFGRKKTLIISNILSLVALFALAHGTSFWILVLYTLLNAGARSLLSGTDSALLYDTLDNKLSYKKWQGIMGSMWALGASISAFIGGFLANISIRFTIFATMLFFGLALLTSLFLKDVKYKKEKHSFHQHIIKSALHCLTNRNILILIIASFIIFATMEVPHQFVSLFLQNKSITLTMMGIFSTLSFGFSFLGGFLSDKISKIGDKNAIILSLIGAPLLYIVSTYLNGFLVGFLIAVSSFFWGYRRPILLHEININTKSSKRATVISLYNLTNSLGVAIFAPVFSIMIMRFNVVLAYRLFAIFALLSLLPIIFLKVRCD